MGVSLGERFVFLGWSGVLLFPTAYLSIGEAIAAESSTGMHVFHNEQVIHCDLGAHRVRGECSCVAIVQRS